MKIIKNNAVREAVWRMRALGLSQEVVSAFEKERKVMVSCQDSVTGTLHLDFPDKIITRLIQDAEKYSGFVYHVHKQITKRITYISLFTVETNNFVEDIRRDHRSHYYPPLLEVLGEYIRALKSGDVWAHEHYFIENKLPSVLLSRVYENYYEYPVPASLPVKSADGCLLKTTPKCLAGFEDFDLDSYKSIILKVLYFSRWARKKGLLALEEKKDGFFKIAVEAITGPFDPDKCRRVLAHKIFADCCKGRELLERLLITNGLIWIAEGRNNVEELYGSLLMKGDGQ